MLLWVNYLIKLNSNFFATFPRNVDCTWKDNIKMGLNETGRDSVNSIYVVQDGEKRVFCEYSNDYAGSIKCEKKKRNYLRAS
jgi:hypothetical protein